MEEKFYEDQETDLQLGAVFKVNESGNDTERSGMSKVIRAVET